MRFAVADGATEGWQSGSWAAYLAGCFVRVEGQVRFAMGKHRGQPLDVIAASRPDYLEWMLTQSFFADTKKIARQALAAARAASRRDGGRGDVAGATASRPVQPSRKLSDHRGDRS